MVLVIVHPDHTTVDGKQRALQALSDLSVEILSVVLAVVEDHFTDIRQLVLLLRKVINTIDT